VRDRQRLVYHRFDTALRERLRRLVAEAPSMPAGRSGRIPARSPG